jgi:ubiquinone/menaquinone biosynthesis C-methylase UbiE
MYTRNWQKFFHDEAPRYLDNCFTKNTDFEVRFLIDELGLKAGDRVLDIGCGTGRHSLGLAKEKMAVTGIDLSPDMLGVARRMADERGLDITFIQGDASQVRLDEKFDHAIIICEGAFSLFEEGMEPFQYHLDILKNVNGMLKPGGKFLMTVLNGFKKIREHSDEDIKKGVFDPVTLSTFIEMDLNDGSKAALHEKGFLPRELTQMLGEAGFRVLNLWGGTAGEWNRQPLKLDEYEIMVVSRKTGN